MKLFLTAIALGLVTITYAAPEAAVDRLARSKALADHARAPSIQKIGVAVPLQKKTVAPLEKRNVLIRGLKAK